MEYPMDTIMERCETGPVRSDKVGAREEEAKAKYVGVVEQVEESDSALSKIAVLTCILGNLQASLYVHSDETAVDLVQTRKMIENLHRQALQEIYECRLWIERLGNHLGVAVQWNAESQDSAPVDEPPGSAEPEYDPNVKKWG